MESGRIGVEQPTNSNLKPQSHNGTIYWWCQGEGFTTGRAVASAPYNGYYTLGTPNYSGGSGGISFTPYVINFGIKTYLSAGAQFGYDIKCNKTTALSCSAVYSYSPT